MLVPPGESVAETKSCKSCATTFHITDKDLEFYDKVSPIFNGKKELIPPPTLCPECRQRRRLAFRNERKLYKRKCDLTGKEIVSIYSADKPYKVYEQAAWWSDGWGAMSYGLEYDFSRPFSRQFRALHDAVPFRALEGNYSTNENSNYTNNTGICKNCYLVFNSGKCEDCAYCTNSRLSRDCYDNLGSRDCQNCFECSYCHESSDLFWSRDCRNCRESYYLQDCVNCRNCFDCSNLDGKEFFIGNLPYGKEAYFARIAELLADRSFMPTEAHFFPAVRGYSNENCQGDQLYNCKDSFECYDNVGLENCKWWTFTNGTSGGTHNSYDFDYFGTVESVYEVSSVGISVSGVRFGLHTFDHVSDLLYCMHCTNSSHLFACVGLRHKQYCILNKQYTRDEYEVLVPRIIEHMRKTGEWGEFFSPSISPFGYNETVAMEYFPLSKEQALSQWFNWSDYEAPFPKVDKIIPANKLPQNIEDIPDDILNWAIECEVTKKPYRIIKQELEFYRKHNLPIPRRHPDQRHLDRLALRNPRKLYERNCDKCSEPMVTTYAPDRPETVYCEECYRREVYG